MLAPDYRCSGPERLDAQASADQDSRRSFLSMTLQIFQDDLHAHAMTEKDERSIPCYAQLAKYFGDIVSQVANRNI